jgi:hypothetical protein
MMKRLCTLCPSLLFVYFLQAQLPEDALRMAYIRPNGTAREQAIGGAMGSLGGDISATYVNPAGLAFYKTGELLLTPGWAFGTTKTSYLSTDMKTPPAGHFIMGTSGFVKGWGDQKSTTTISLSVNQTADFKNQFSYQGNNNYSSASEAYYEEFKASGLSVDQALAEPGLSYGTRMALYTYLIDTSQGGLGPTIFQPGKVLDSGGQLSQHTNIRTCGGVTEIDLGVAGMENEKFYYGLTIGFPIVNYQQTIEYTETDLSGNAHNDFGSYNYTESYSSTGAGVVFRLGGIYRPNLNWRIGLAVHSPSFYYLTDRVSANMVTNSEDYAGTRSVSSATMDQQANAGNSLKYQLYTPWHFLVSGSYIFPGQLTEGKMGFITADIEYQTNTSSKFSFQPDDNGNHPDNSYYDPLNSTIKSYYKNTFNFRMGGEYKVDELAFRIGGSYSMNPYRSPDLKANLFTISGGIGYRKNGIFVDLTYVEAISNNVNFPYRLEEKDNVYSTVKKYTGNILLTFGIKI